MDQANFWSSEYTSGLSVYTDGSRTRTVDIGGHKLSIPTHTSSLRPIERFNSGEGPLPMGLLPNPAHGFPPMLPAAMPGLTFSPSDQDAKSWRSSNPEDDRNSLSTDSGTSSGNAMSTHWNPRGSFSTLSDYQSTSLPMAFQENAPSPPESSYQYRASEVIDPSLTLNYQDPDILGHKEPAIKFEFSPPCFLQIDDGEYEHDTYADESPTGNYYHRYEHEHAPTHTVLPSFDNSWARKTPMTRSQSQSEGKHQFGSRNSGNGSPKSSRSLKTLSPTSSKKIIRRRGSSSSSEESHTRNNSRPKTYKKKIPFFTCKEEECKEIRFRNRSELKKHTETQHTKPYICIFGFANCKQRFGARNEWKRHIATQHLELYKYVCDHPRCRDKPKAKILFNRGDLFNKHQERMHCPPELVDRKPDDLDLIAWKNEMRKAKDRCEELRIPPQKMTCGFCDEIFERGDKTWMELVDHVGVHYQQGDQEVHGEWKDDLDLIAWMREHNLYSEDDTMDVESETPDSRKSRKHSFASSSDYSSAARQIKQEQMEV